MCGIVEVNAFVVWGDTVELDDGFRLRLSLTDWKRLNLERGEAIPVRLPGKNDLWVWVADVIDSRRPLE